MKLLTLILLIAFGLLTLFLSSSVLFDWFGIRAMEGNYVPLIVYINFISSLLYLVAAYLILKENKRAFTLLVFSVILLLFGSIALQFHIKNGGLYELKTPKAMLFRTLITMVLAVLSYLIFHKKKSLK